jgi:hypothetical protein
MASTYAAVTFVNVQYESNFAQVGIQYIYGQLCIYVYRPTRESSSKPKIQHTGS